MCDIANVCFWVVGLDMLQLFSAGKQHLILEVCGSWMKSVQSVEYFTLTHAVTDRSWPCALMWDWTEPMEFQEPVTFRIRCAFVYSFGDGNVPNTRYLSPLTLLLPRRTGLCQKSAQCI